MSPINHISHIYEGTEIRQRKSFVADSSSYVGYSQSNAVRVDLVDPLRKL